MANHTKTVTLTDLQQQILSNDLYNDSDNAGLDAWIQDAVNGKYPVPPLLTTICC